MIASEAKEQANKVNGLNVEYLDDRILGGIEMEIHTASKEGEYSIEYTFTANLTYADLLYCQDKLREMDYSVSVNKKSMTILIDWSEAEIDE